MKNVVRRLVSIALISGCALVYVGLQIEIFRVSYSIHKNEVILSQTRDRFESMKMQVSRLKAFDSLESQIEAANMGLTLPTEVKTVEVAIPEKVMAPIEIQSPKFPFSLMQFVKEAHAKIISPGKE